MNRPLPAQTRRAVLIHTPPPPGVELHAPPAQGVAHSVHETCTDSARAVARGAAFGIFHVPLPTPGAAHGGCAKRCARHARTVRTYLRTALRAA